MFVRFSAKSVWEVRRADSSAPYSPPATDAQRDICRTVGPVRPQPASGTPIARCAAVGAASRTLTANSPGNYAEVCRWPSKTRSQGTRESRPPRKHLRACLEDLQGRPDRRADPTSRTRLGRGGAVRANRRRGEPVRLRTRPRRSFTISVFELAALPVPAPDCGRSG